ncbi:MAG: glycerol-3-phosphate 1-O-acyltransferase PlsY [Eubacteriales bacterium]|nr:glycerol-3-phosphate 1-O-acyltransferase PlsY [Eubacteriales bacterium]
MITEFILSVIVAYLIGSLNASIIFSKLTGKEDIRTKGSGNAGMTNMLRNNGKKSAAFVLIVDGLKGVLAVLLVRLFTDSIIWMCCASFFVVLGHVYPIYFGFRGGKGIATALFSIGALPHGWIISLILIGLFLPLVYFTRIVSIASLTCTATYPLLVYLFNKESKENIIYSFIILALLFFTHRSNIVRLIKGQENKFGGYKK